MSVDALNLTLQLYNRALRVLSLKAKGSVSFYWWFEVCVATQGSQRKLSRNFSGQAKGLSQTLRLCCPGGFLDRIQISGSVWMCPLWLLTPLAVGAQASFFQNPSSRVGRWGSTRLHPYPKSFIFYFKQT